MIGDNDKTLQFIKFCYSRNDRFMIKPLLDKIFKFLLANKKNLSYLRFQRKLESFPNVFDYYHS